MINETINKKILAIWKKHFDSRDDVLAPIFYDDFKQGGILFVGMNPSFSPPKIRLIVRGTEFENLEPESFYRWSNIVSDEKNIDMCIKIGRYVHAKYTFFKRMHEIAEVCKTFYQHLDLFVYKQTRQKEFLSLVREEKKGPLNEFGQDQLNIFLEALQSIRPVVIVVSNASATKIVKEYFKNRLSFDEEHGYYQLKLDDISVPTFFSSMLSGAGMLDTGSYERLKWHIKQAVCLKYQ